MTIKNPIVKNILSAVTIIFFGFVLLNLTFLLDFLFQSIIDSLISFFTKADFMAWPWLPLVKHSLFAVVIGLISWLVFRSKIRDFYKATFLTVPTAVVLVTIGILLFHWPIAVYSISGLLVAGALCYLYRTKKPWLYWYAVILVSLALAIMSLTGAEI